MTTAERPAVGIDLGTTFSVVAYLDPAGVPQTVPSMEGDLTTPSVVFFDHAETVVGREALRAATYEPEAVAQFVKRDMGKRFFHRPIRGVHLPPEVIQAAILGKLRRDAELRLSPFADVVITVPAFFNEPRRKATMDAGRLAGLNVLDIINEPTAAAIAYGLKAGFVTESGQARQHENILVYDLGGGTFDVTLMSLEGATYTALATDGDMQLGGIDWDHRIADYVAEQLQAQVGADLRQDPITMQALLREAEDVKRALSTRQNVTFRYSHQGHLLYVPLTRDVFESLATDLVERTIFTTAKLLRDARVTWADVTRVLLVGGATRMPMIHKALERESGKQLDRSLSPDEAVAHGAAVYAGFLMHGARTADRSLVVNNVNSHDLGVLAVETTTGMTRRRVMIPRNSKLPARSKNTFVTKRDQQRTVVVNVVEGGDDSGKNATAIGKCVVSKLPKLPAGTQVVVQFYYSTNGRLSVKASVPSVGLEASSAIERASGMTDEMLQEWQGRVAQNQFLSAPPTAAAAPAPAAASEPLGGIIPGPPPKPVRSAKAAASPPASTAGPAPAAPPAAANEDSEVFRDLNF